MQRGLKMINKIGVNVHSDYYGKKCEISHNGLKKNWFLNVGEDMLMFKGIWVTVSKSPGAMMQEHL